MLVSIVFSHAIQILRLRKDLTEVPNCPGYSVASIPRFLYDRRTVCFATSSVLLRRNAHSRSHVAAQCKGPLTGTRQDSMRKETFRDVPTRTPRRKGRKGGLSEDAGSRDRLETVLAFETLISKLSGTFVNLPSEQVDREIESWLGCIAEFLGMELATVAQFSQDMSDVCFTHGWARDGLEPPSNVHNVDRWPWGLDQIRHGHIVQFTNVEELPEEASTDKQSFRDVGSISHISIPLTVAEKIIGVLSFGARHVVDEWPNDFIQRFRVIGDVFSNALMRKRSDENLQKAFSEIEALKEQLEAENAYLNEQIGLKEYHKEIVGESTAIRSVLKQIEQVAGTDSTVVIHGETGTGKELVANAIHRLSKRNSCPFVKVNCAAIPTTLLESELFGREKGAFTGALSKGIGRFEMAHSGTILLDEVSEIPVEVQSKLLRVLEHGTIERLGSSKTIKVDARIIASTNRDLEKAVHEGSFRADLYYRLNVFSITVPPLRDRKDDIPMLVWWFVRKYSNQMDKRIDQIPRRVMEAFQQQRWPGNVRELMNAVEHCMIISDGPTLNSDLPKQLAKRPSKLLSLEEVERNHIVEALKASNWKVRGKGGAAELLKIKPTTLQSRMKKLGIHRPH